MTGNKSIVFKFADVEVREREFRLVKAGEVLPVEPKTFRVLLYLLRNPQKLIAKEELLNAVWGDAAVTDSSLTRTIAQLRRLLGDEIRNPRYIETVAKVTSKTAARRRRTARTHARACDPSSAAAVRAILQCLSTHMSLAAGSPARRV